MVDLNNFFKLLEEKNINANKLSIETGISTGNISDWKKGRSYPTAQKLVIIADYLDCSIDYLLGRTENPKINQK
ncbi:helix-turn-helix transcriptional regulator [Paludicola sp. MB14-C6]|uniref:helix-turn-helix domain-containing protein n=1 Tax=Paludihabitans sp. MB14-C6 TaxID=3070656 RepID=UPI0027DC1DBE|nr:helix-turn-helix transcriptional regulator [Paludicola sp. MB14-C6]WMJ23347.1 helix-turn-helix transcriptional regulator [Paludicola sp. MB14-C6]